MKEQLMNMENDRKNSSTTYINKNDKKKERSEAMTATTWRDLIPVIKIDICSVRISNIYQQYKKSTFIFFYFRDVLYSVIV